MHSPSNQNCGACHPQGRSLTVAVAYRGCRGPRRAAFSLIELLTVVAIISILAVGGMVGFQSIGSGQKLAQHVEELSGSIRLAHAMAQTKSATVWLGIVPQEGPPAQLVVRAYIVMDGGIKPIDAADFRRVGKDKRLKMTSLDAAMAANKTESRPTASVSIPAGGAWIIIRPSGDVRIAIPSSAMTLEAGDNMENLPDPLLSPERLIEIGLRSAEGGNPSNVAAIQIAGLTGAVSIYKP